MPTPFKSHCPKVVSHRARCHRREGRRAHPGGLPGESVCDMRVLLSDQTGSILPPVHFPAGLLVRSATALLGASGTVPM